jgi:hypothetical protein
MDARRATPDAALKSRAIGQLKDHLPYHEHSYFVNYGVH